MNLHPLFPTPVAFADFPRDFTTEELDFIMNQDQRPNMGNTTSSNNFVLDRPELADIREFCQASIDDYLAQVYASTNNVGLRITQSWFNYTGNNQFHHRHDHPNSVVSGVFYIQSNKLTDKIFFYKKLSNLRLPTENFNPYNSESWWFEAVPRQLILFPSTLEHSVETLKDYVGTRVSMSFNTFFTGDVGSLKELTFLSL